MYLAGFCQIHEISRRTQLWQTSRRNSWKTYWDPKTWQLYTSGPEGKGASPPNSPPPCTILPAMHVELFTRRRSPCSTIRDIPLAWYLITAKFVPSSCQVPNSNLAAKLQLGKSWPSSYLAAKFFWLGILSTSSARSDCHVQTWLPSFEWLPSWNLERYWFAKLKKHEKAGRH